MKITLYMATSIDGFIAKKDGDSDWVSAIDTVNFEKKIQENGCIVMGNRTFEQFKGEIYPVAGVTNLVLTTKSTDKSNNDNVVYVQSPSEAIKVANENKHDKILLIGGGTTNGLFLKDNLIDEIILSVHPLVLGEGIKLFENVENKINLEFLNQTVLDEGLIQLHYRVIK